MRERALRAELRQDTVGVTALFQARHARKLDERSVPSLRSFKQSCCLKSNELFGNHEYSERD